MRGLFGNTSITQKYISQKLRNERIIKMGYAKKFYDAFVKCLNERKFTKDEYASSPKWTSIMLGNNTGKKRLSDETGYGIVGQAIQKTFEKGIKTEKEYYRIDMIGWEDRKSEINKRDCKNNMKKYLWDLNVAVEHENDSTQWLDEVCKLAYIRCPLRVVISYGEGDIEAAKFILKETRAFTNDDQEVLIILGKSSNEFTDTVEDLYTPYIITAKDLEEINS